VGQKVNPIGFRIGITEGWRSRWYAPKPAFGDFLVEDQKVRGYINAKLNGQAPYAAVSRVDIERTRDEVKVVLYTARPGVVIGPRGAEVDKLKEHLEHLIDRKVAVNIMEVKQPDVNAQLVAEGVAEQLKRRGSFRRAMKQRCEAAMSAGAKGIKIIAKGRLGGSDMARRETQLLGSIPLSTLQAKIDYGYAMSRTTYGAIGVRVWINAGRYDDPIVAEERPAGRGPARRMRR